jgi:hypothetical protein
MVPVERVGFRPRGYGPIPAGMDESFAFGKPARRHAAGKTRTRRAPRADRAPGGTGRGRLLLLVVGGVVVVLMVAGYMAFMKDSGAQIASDNQTAISQIGVAKDVDAKMTAQQTVGAVQELYAEQGSFAAITPSALRHFEPTFSYTGEASTGPQVVSVNAASGGVGLAVLSESGTCFYLRFGTSGVTYGTGGTCTGNTAMAAAASGWPTS